MALGISGFADCGFFAFMDKMLRLEKVGKKPRNPALYGGKFKKISKINAFCKNQGFVNWQMPCAES